MKATEIRRRVERIKKHTEEGKLTVAHDEGHELAVDFVRAAAAGCWGIKPQGLAKEVLQAFEGK